MRKALLVTGFVLATACSLPVDHQRAIDAQQEVIIHLREEIADIRAGLEGATPNERLVMADKIAILEHRETLANAKIEELEKRGRESNALDWSEAGLLVAEIGAYILVGGLGTESIRRLRRRAAQRRDENMRAAQDATRDPGAPV